MSTLPRSITFRIEFIIEPDDGQFHAFCPALKGLHVAGSTAQEALQNAKDGAEAYLMSLIKHNEAIPLEVVAVESSAKSTASAKKRTHHTEEFAVALA